MNEHLPPLSISVDLLLDHVNGASILKNHSALSASYVRRYLCTSLGFFGVGEGWEAARCASLDPPQGLLRFRNLSKESLCTPA